MSEISKESLERAERLFPCEGKNCLKVSAYPFRCSQCVRARRVAAEFDAVAREAKLDALKGFRDAHELGYVPAMGEFAGYYDTASIGSNWSEKELDRRIADLEKGGGDGK